MRKLMMILTVIMVFAFASSVLAAVIDQITSLNGTTPFSPSAAVKVNAVSLDASYCAQASQTKQGTVEYGTCGGTGTAKDVSKLWKRDCGGAVCGDPGTPSATDLSGAFVAQ